MHDAIRRTGEVVGLRTKGSMYCPHCDAPVLGVKTTHRVRNASSTFLLPFTGALSLLGLRVERYRCPRCGFVVHRRQPPAVRAAAAALTALVLLIVLVQHL